MLLSDWNARCQPPWTEAELATNFAALLSTGVNRSEASCTGATI